MRAAIYILALWCVSAALAHAWSDPILVTPDTAVSQRSRAVFDGQGFMHVFFANKRYQTVPSISHYDVFHCKLTQNGVRLTEDLRLDSTSTDLASQPSPVFGSDGKLHVLWDDFS